jgi:hypothetical protein
MLEGHLLPALERWGLEPIGPISNRRAPDALASSTLAYPKNPKNDLGSKAFPNVGVSQGLQALGPPPDAGVAPGGPPDASAGE